MSHLLKACLTLVAVPALAVVIVLSTPAAGVAQDTDDTVTNVPADTTTVATSQDEAEKKIRILLSAYHGFPTRAELLDISQDASSILVEIASDEDALPTMRSRAVDALGFFDDEVSKQYLSSLLASSDDVEERLVHHAVTAYSKAFESDSLELIQPFLEDDDVQMRMTAVAAVQKHGGDAGRVILEKRLDVEKSKIVRKEIQDRLANPAPVQ